MSKKAHWEQIYSTKQIKSLGWYIPHIQPTLDWISKLNLDSETPIIDIGGGASTLVDDLLEAGYQNMTVLDLSGSALLSAKTRLGDKAGTINWLEADITLPVVMLKSYYVWHDRAVFHFLTEADQEKYLNNLKKVLIPGGHLITGTFALEGPDSCSGLPVVRYDAKELSDKLGTEFVLLKQQKELHITPWGMEQMFLYCHFQRVL
jgi:SAM-dependent methyltransferase